MRSVTRFLTGVLGASILMLSAGRVHAQAASPDDVATSADGMAQVYSRIVTTNDGAESQVIACLQADAKYTPSALTMGCENIIDRMALPAGPLSQDAGFHKLGVSSGGTRFYYVANDLKSGPVVKGFDMNKDAGYPIASGSAYIVMPPHMPNEGAIAIENNGMEILYEPNKTDQPAKDAPATMTKSEFVQWFNQHKPNQVLAISN
jgi:hypothetical protein